MLCKWKNIEILERDIRENYIHMIVDISDINNIRGNRNTKWENIDKSPSKSSGF